MTRTLWYLMAFTGLGLLCGCRLAPAPPSYPARFHLGQGAYGELRTVSDRDNARWDWLLFNFGTLEEDVLAVQRHNRYLALNPRQKYIVRLWPINNVGRAEYGGIAHFLDYRYDPVVRDAINTALRRQVRLVLDNISKPENVVGFTFLEELPGWWGMGSELRLPASAAMPRALTIYQKQIEAERGQPLAWNEALWRWLGQAYVESLADIHRLIRQEAPDKIVLYWHHVNYATLDELAAPAFPDSAVPQLYPYRYADIIRPGLCDGFVAIAGRPAEQWENKYLRFARQHHWLFFCQLSHPGQMRLTDWATAIQQARTPLPENLGYFFYCGAAHCSEPSEFNDPHIPDWEEAFSGRFVTRTRLPERGHVVEFRHRFEPHHRDHVYSHLMQTPIPVTAGQSYEVAAWFKTDQVEGREGAVVIVVFDDSVSGMRLRRDDVMRRTGTHPWQRVTGTVTAPPQATSARIYVGMRAANGMAWFDDISFRPAGSDTELLKNSGLEEGTDRPPRFADWFIEDESLLVCHWQKFCDQQRIGRHLPRERVGH